jgi:hypothetical protein
MAEKIAGAYIELVPQLAKNFKQQVEKDAQTAGNAVAKNVSSGSTVATKAVDKVKSSFSNLAKTAWTLGGGLALAKVFNDSIAEARESYRVNRLTAQALKSTGDASNVSAGQVSHLADSLSGVVGIDDEVIQGMENLLLRFTKVRNEAGKGNDIFNRTTKAILDVSAATGKGLTPVTIALGKALTDPIKGMAGLARFGVQFTDQQKAQIKTLVDSGHQLEAQKVILDSLGQRFGGAAKAAADPMQRLGVTFKNLEENLGKLLVPALNVGVAALQSFVSFVQNNAKTIKVLTAVLAPLVAGLTAMLIVKKVGDGIKAMREAVIALNIAMDANPAILIAGAIAALGVGLVIAYQKIKPFHDAVDAVGRALRDAFGWVQDHWRQILPILIAPFIALPIMFRHQIGAFLSALFSAGVNAIAGLARGAAARLPALLVWFGTLPGRVIVAIGAIGARLLPKGVEAVAGFFLGVVRRWVAVEVWWAGVGVRVIRAVGAAGAWLISKGSAAIVGLKNGAVNGFRSVAAWFAGLPRRILSALGDLGNILYDAGKRIIGGLARGIKDAGGSVLTGALHQVTKLIPLHKGPPAKDRALLADNGRLIMQGLIRGLESQRPALIAALGRTTRLIDVQGHPTLAAQIAQVAPPQPGDTLRPMAGQFQYTQNLYSLDPR